MLNRALQHVSPSPIPFRLHELVLLTSLFGLGAWELQVGLENPSYVGWISGGVVRMTGTTACAWLIWCRRNTQRSILLLLMLVMEAASVVEDILEWRAGKEGATWPVMHCILGLLFLALMIAEEISHRKEDAKDATRESKIFSMEDPL